MIKRNDSLMVQGFGVQSHQYLWESVHMKEREISMTKRGYKWFSAEIFMLFASHSGTFWWDSSRAGINGLCTYLSQVEKVRIS